MDGLGWAGANMCKHIPTRFVVALLLSETAVSLPMIFLCMVMYGYVLVYIYNYMQFYSMCIMNIIHTKHIYIYVCVHLVAYILPVIPVPNRGSYRHCSG